MSKFVTVNITRETKAITEKGFGLPLVLATSKALAYKVYTDISEVQSDFAVDTKEYKLLNRMFAQNPRPAEIAVYGVNYTSTDAESLVTALNDLLLTKNDFYYLVSPEQGLEEVTALAEWASTQDKIYAASTDSEDVYESLKGLYDNVYLLVHDNPGTYPAEGLAALLASQIIGSYTWTFKSINGVQPATYSATKIKDIEDNYANTYIQESGVNITSGSKSTSGEYIDIIQGQHFIKAKIAENVFGALVRNKKVPYTSAGIALIAAEVEKALTLAAQNGVIATENGEYQFAIDVPTIESIPTNNKAGRILPDIPWTATVAGAIEKVNINGVLSI